MIKITSKLKYKNRYYSSIRLYVMQGGRACFGPIVVSVKVLITGQGIDNHRPFIFCFSGGSERGSVRNKKPPAMPV